MSNTNEPGLMSELLLAVGRLEGKMDSHLVDVKALREELLRMDQRVQKVERNWAWVLGAAAAIGAVSAFITNLLNLALNHSSH